MRYDANTRLSDQQVITTTAYSTNSYPLKSSHDLSGGDTFMLSCHVDQTFAGGTSLTIGVLAHWNPDPATSVATTIVQVLGTSELLLVASNFLVAGADIMVPIAPSMQSKMDLMQAAGGFAAIGLPPAQPGYLYLTAVYTVDGTMTAGKLTTHIVPHSYAKRRLYPYSRIE